VTHCSSSRTLSGARTASQHRACNTHSRRSQQLRNALSCAACDFVATRDPSIRGRGAMLRIHMYRPKHGALGLRRRSSGQRDLELLPAGVRGCTHSTSPNPLGVIHAKAWSTCNVCPLLTPVPSPPTLPSWLCLCCCGGNYPHADPPSTPVSAQGSHTAASFECCMFTLPVDFMKVDYVHAFDA
jgi:hypothetical protein